MTNFSLFMSANFLWLDNIDTDFLVVNVQILVNRFDCKILVSRCSTLKTKSWHVCDVFFTEKTIPVHIMWGQLDKVHFFCLT